MKKITSLIKTIIAAGFCLFVSIAGFSQKSNEKFNGWNMSFHAGATTGNSNLHWYAPLQVNQISNLVYPGGMLITVPAAFVTIPDTSMHNTGIVASIRIGYKKTFGHLLLGAEAGISINSFKASQTTTFYPETMLQARNPLTIQRTISSGLSKMLEVKFGYTTGKHLVYAMTGIVFNPVAVSSSDDYRLSFQNKRAHGATAAAPGTYNYTSILHEQKEVHTLMGISWGAGYQYLVSEGISIGIEYRQTSFGKVSYTTEKVTGEQAVDATGARVGIAAGLEASNISVNMKQQALTFKVDVALSAIFKK
jgi:opacity protein-like surface antigen